jgi:hypothetical protein
VSNIRIGDYVESDFHKGPARVVFVRSDGRLVRVETIMGLDEWLLPRDIKKHIRT